MDDAGPPRPHDDSRAEPSELEQRATELLRAAEDAAAAKGRAMVAEARAVRKRMLEDAERRRGLVRAELERVRRVLDEAFAALDEGERPAPTDDAEPTAVNTAEADRRVADVFDQLRSTPASPPAARKKPTPKRKDATKSEDSSARSATSDVDQRGENEGDTKKKQDTSGDTEPVPESAPEPAAPADPDDAVRIRRDAVLAPLIPDLVRSAKRLLQDEQNLLLDSVRRARNRIDPARLLPDHVRHREVWATTLGAAADVAYESGRSSAGRRRKPANAPARLVNELAARIVAPLRERLTTTIDSVVAEGPYPSTPELNRALASAIGARYREWKARDLEVTLLDVLSAAYARGAYDAAPGGARLRWVPDRPGRCPDCDDDALEVTVKAKLFPTGQAYPPAHPGCRCIVVPAADEPDRGTASTTM